jgi:hypothetical protein
MKEITFEAGKMERTAEAAVGAKIQVMFEEVKSGYFSGS